MMMLVHSNPPQNVLIDIAPSTEPTTITPAASSSAAADNKANFDNAPMQTDSRPPEKSQKAKPLTPEEKAKLKEKLDKSFPLVPPGEEMYKLSDDEFTRLVIATNSYEKARVFNLITSLQAQLKEHQSVLDRLAESESERRRLAERNQVLEKQLEERVEQESRVQALEGEVIGLKIDLANEKCMMDEVQLNRHKLSIRNETLEKENERLKNRVNIDASDRTEDVVVRTDFRFHGVKDAIDAFNVPTNGSSRAITSIMSSEKGRRSSLTRSCSELTSSTRTTQTEASTASGTSQQSAMSDGFLCCPEGITKQNRKHANVRRASATESLTESSEEGDCEKTERNFFVMTKNWIGAGRVGGGNDRA